VPDFLFACAATALTMGATFFAATLTGDDVVAGGAGTDLARLFAASLGVAGVFASLLGALLLGDEPDRADHFVFPCVLGILVGAVEAVFFLWPVRFFLLFPLIFLVFSLRPLRKGVRAMLGGGAAR
jgi:hypothetical protein